MWLGNILIAARVRKISKLYFPFPTPYTPPLPLPSKFLQSFQLFFFFFFPFCCLITELLFLLPMNFCPAILSLSIRTVFIPSVSLVFHQSSHPPFLVCSRNKHSLFSSDTVWESCAQLFNFPPLPSRSPPINPTLWLVMQLMFCLKSCLLFL